MNKKKVNVFKKERRENNEVKESKTGDDYSTVSVGGGVPARHTALFTDHAAAFKTTKMKRENLLRASAICGANVLLNSLELTMPTARLELTPHPKSTLTL